MKKSVFLLLVCASLLLSLLSACSSPAPAPTEEVPTPTPEPVALSNPIHETDEQGLVLAAGISLPAPEGAQDVRWSYIELVNEPHPIAQMDFTLGESKAFLRAQATGETEIADISGLSYDWTETADAEVLYCKARVYTNGEAGYIAWLDVAPGILYNLGMSEGASAEKLTALANAAFVPLQGDVDRDAEESSPYRELIDKVAAGLRDGWTGVTVEELGISEMFGRPGAEELGWLQKDVNGDGVDELLFGKTPEDGASPIYDIFSLLGGKLVHPSTGWEFNCWYLLADGIFYNEWSSNGYDHYGSAYGLFNGKLIPANRLVDRSEFLRLTFEPFPI